MRNKMMRLLMAMGFGLAVCAARAQDDNGGPPPDGGPGMGGHHKPPLIISALDVNHDGVIDSNEIANASAELKTLDKNGDGKLTWDEYMGGDAPANDTASGQPKHVPPIIAALDVNGDGVIDATEIANATAELKTLDKNGDGKLTRNEYMGPHPHHGPDDGGGPDGLPPDGQ